MGYTHYFQQNKTVTDEQWGNFEKDANVVIGHAQKNMGIGLSSDDPNGVILNSERLNLNGDNLLGLSHETFFLKKDLKTFNFCKTNEKPYDIVVCSLLLLAHKHMPNHHRITSDGNFPDWKEAMQLNAELFGYAFELPTTVDSSEAVTEFEANLKKQFVKAESPTLSNKKVIVKKVK